MTNTLRTSEHIYLCERLKRVRLDAGLTQAELAKRLGKPQSFVAKVETKERRLDVIEFAKWMAACGSLGAVPEIVAAIAGGRAES